jgi:hypothetical protein
MVAAAGRQPRAVEAIDGRPVGRDEGDMGAAGRRAGAKGAR